MQPQPSLCYQNLRLCGIRSSSHLISRISLAGLRDLVQNAPEALSRAESAPVPGRKRPNGHEKPWKNYEKTKRTMQKTSKTEENHDGTPMQSLDLRLDGAPGAALRRGPEAALRPGGLPGGVAFERSTLQRWLQKHGSCPVTGEALRERLKGLVEI